MEDDGDFASEKDDEYRLSDDEVEDMGVFYYLRIVGIVLCLVGVGVSVWVDLFYGLLVIGLGGVCFAVFRLSFFVVKAREMYESFFGE